MHVVIETIDRALSAPSWTLRFAPQLEAKFIADTFAYDAKRMAITGVIACILYDIFLVSDYSLMSDVFWSLFAVRIFVFTPICLSICILSYLNPEKYFRLGTLSALNILAVTGIMVVFAQSNSPYREAYSYGSMLVMIYGSVVQRPRLGSVIVSVVGIVIVQETLVFASDFLDINSLLASIIFFVTGSILLIISTYILEMTIRRNYLLTLRSQLLNEKLAIMANTDQLTGLGNRRMLEDAGKTLWSTGATEPRTISVILLDIDRFKLFNDSYGHLQGDQCLSQIAQCLTQNLRASTDMAIRFGGEEMLVLLPDTDLTAARHLAERFRLAIRAVAIPHPALGADAVVSASFGVASGLTSDLSPKELVAHADIALYAAKRDGRDRVWPPLGATSEAGLPDETAIQAVG